MHKHSLKNDPLFRRTVAASLLVRKANPDALMRSLKRGHQHANKLPMVQPKLVWPQARSPKQSHYADPASKLESPNVNRRLLQQAGAPVTYEEPEFAPPKKHKASL